MAHKAGISVCDIGHNKTEHILSHKSIKKNKLNFVLESSNSFTNVVFYYVVQNPFSACCHVEFFF